LGTKVSNDVSAVIAGKKSVDDALNSGQKLAEVVSKKYQGQ
jgi:sorbitol/mannitol transport system substrate-binding protein